MKKKKTKLKLALKQETVRKLVEAELTHVAGGSDCTFVTGRASTCA